MNAMARRLQPHILINDRSKLPEDLTTPEERIVAEGENRAWEACMTLNATWGCMPCVPDEDWLSVRDVLAMLCSVTSGGGNLLLNIGPEADGSVQRQASEALTKVGKWLAKNGEAVYGKVDRTEGRFEWHPAGSGHSINPWTLKGRTAYFWVARWPGQEIVIGGIKTKVTKASLLSTGKAIKFRQKQNRLILYGLVKTNPDKIAKVSVIKLQFAGKPRQVLGPGCEGDGRWI
jgi:alpha-L-fucosidase